MSKISIVVPCYNEEKVVRLLFEETNKIFESELKEHEPEYIFVDDGSKDDTYEIAKRNKERHPNIVLLRNERNLGLHDGRNQSAWLLVFCAWPGNLARALHLVCAINRNLAWNVVGGATGCKRKGRR